MSKATNPPTTPRTLRKTPPDAPTAVILPFARPAPCAAAAPLLTEAVEEAIAFVEGLPADGLLGHALLTIQVSEKLARPGSGAQSIHAALIAFLCLARALDHVGLPVAEMVS